jgi:hypothetical protein
MMRDSLSFSASELGARSKGLRLSTVAALVWIAAFAVGCGEQRLGEAELSFATRAITVDPGRALVTLPPGGPPMVSVTQRSYENAVTQTIALSTRGRTAGENAIHVAFLTAADPPDTTGVEGPLFKEPSIEDFAIAREMEERLPGIAMSPSAVYVQNRYGPFGYAFGRSAAGEACLYAWQRIASGDSIFRPRSGVISVRIRVCEPGVSESALLRLAYGYSVNAQLRRSGWNPVGEAPPPPAGLGEAGTPIYPMPQASPGTFAEASERPATRARPVRAVRPRPARAEPTDPIPDRPLEGYPTVPPPPAN